MHSDERLCWEQDVQSPDATKLGKLGNALMSLELLFLTLVSFPQLGSLNREQKWLLVGSAPVALDHPTGKTPSQVPACVTWKLLLLRLFFPAWALGSSSSELK